MRGGRTKPRESRWARPGEEEGQEAAAGRYDPATREITIARTPRGGWEAEAVRTQLTRQARRKPDEAAAYRQIGRTIRMRPTRLAALAAGSTAVATAMTTTGLTNLLCALVAGCGLFALVTVARHIQLLNSVRTLAQQLGESVEKNPTNQTDATHIETIRVGNPAHEGDY